MGCFIVPGTEAVVSTVVTKVIKKNEKNEEVKGIALSTKFKWLNTALLGGSALLAFEHVWHGEVVPFFPFLTAASNPEDLQQMLFEMGTTGVCMAVVVTAVWGVGCFVADRMVKKANEKQEAQLAPVKVKEVQ